MKPSCVIDYNKNMGAIERSDMLLSSIESVRKTNTTTTNNLVPDTTTNNGTRFA